MSSFNKTILIGSGITKEGKAGGAIAPGSLIQRGSADTLVVHATAGGTAQKIVAIENDVVGNDIDDSYASGDQVKYAYLQPGDEAQMIISETSADIAIGDPLESAGDGTLQKHVADDTTASGATNIGEQIIGFAREALAPSSGDAVSARRIIVEAC